MGRYYSGDINGKFWFAVQSSNAADRFGVEGNDPNFINYYFDKERDLETVQLELKDIETTITLDNIKKLDDFFKTTNGYNDKILKKHNLLEVWNQHKFDYADYILGKKIEECLLKNGYCGFEAEL